MAHKVTIAVVDYHHSMSDTQAMQLTHEIVTAGLAALRERNSSLVSRLESVRVVCAEPATFWQPERTEADSIFVNQEQVFV